MEKDIKILHRKIDRNKIAVFIIIAFLALLSYMLITVSNELSNVQTTESEAAYFSRMAGNNRYLPTKSPIPTFAPKPTEELKPDKPENCYGNIIYEFEKGFDLIKCSNGKTYSIRSGSGADKNYANELCCSFNNQSIYLENEWACKIWWYNSPSLKITENEQQLAVEEACSLLCQEKGGSQCEHYPRANGGNYYCGSPVCMDYSQLDQWCKTKQDVSSCDKTKKCAWYFCAKSSKCRSKLVMGCTVCPDVYQCPW